MNAAPITAPWWLRALFVVLGLAAWFTTQAAIGSRPDPEGVIGDRVHEWLADFHQYLLEHPDAANALLIVSSAIIDLLGVFLLGISIFGRTVRPFLGLLILFGMRQICQSLCPLRGPDGMIWHEPLPFRSTLLVTYDVATDFFFSGHTAMAFLGAVELVRIGGRRWIPVIVFVAVFEALAVLGRAARITRWMFSPVPLSRFIARCWLRGGRRGAMAGWRGFAGGQKSRRRPSKRVSWKCSEALIHEGHEGKNMVRFLTITVASLILLLGGAAASHAQSKDFADAKLLWTLPWDADWVTAVSFVGNERVAAGNKLGDILVWDLPAASDAKAPPPARRLAGHSNEINRLLTTPDQKTLLSASNDRTIKYWDMQASGGETGSVVLNTRAIYEAESRKKKAPAPVEAKVQVLKWSQELTGHKDWVLGLSMTADGKTLLSGDDKGDVVVWDLPAGKEVRRWKLGGWAWGLGISPDGLSACIAERVPLVFDSGARSGLKIWNVQTGTIKADLSKEIKERMSAAAYSRDGKWLAICRGGEANGLSGKVTLLDPATGKKLRETTPGHLDGATDLAFHPDGKHIFSSGRDTLVKIWRLEDGKHVRDLGKGRGGQSKDWICAISISPDGQRLAAADMAGQVQIYALTK